MQRYFIFILLSMVSLQTQAIKLSGNVAAEFQSFSQSAQFPDQMDDNLTLSFQPKMSFDWNRGDDLFSMELFFRADYKDENRQHADIRELKWLHVSGDNEWRVGIDAVFWGVTESQHLVDIINQTDRVEGFDGEDKLGQPMIHYTRIEDYGVFHVFVLPGFREPEFRSQQGRLRFPLVVDSDQSLYESDRKDDHVDYALRYEHFIGDTELGLSYFDGTGRDPVLLTGQDDGQPVLIPVYNQITQLGVDLQSIVGDWTWKLELVHQESDSGTFTAGTGGFEYTLYGIMDTAIDLGTLLEYSANDKSMNAGVFDNDLFGGLRFAFNDVQSSEILAGLLVDVDKQSRSFRVEANRRIGSSWKLTGELQVFSGVDDNDPLSAFSRDDYVLLEMARYF